MTPAAPFPHDIVGYAQHEHRTATVIRTYDTEQAARDALQVFADNKFDWIMAAESIDPTDLASIVRYDSFVRFAVRPSALRANLGDSL